MKKAIWLSYDLGIKGDYQGLYAWLDNFDATECGNSVAYVQYQYEKDLLSELKEDLKRSVNFNQGDRIYIIRKDSKDGKVRGSFLIGKRKSNPWEGFGEGEDTSVDIDE